MNKQLLRWLILSLLVANVLVFIWPRETAEPLLDSSTSPAGRLVLLDEIVGEPEPVVAEPGDQGDEAPEAAIVEDASAEAAPETEETLIIEFADMDESTAADAEAAVAETELETERKQPRCWLAGPVESTALTESLNAEFQSRGLALNLVLRRVATQPDHWVYLKVDSGLEERRRLSTQLRKRGIDHFPITDGELSGNLSLGLFRSADGAEILAARVREAGYPVEIFLRPRYREEAWIALADDARTALGWSEEPGLLLQHPEMRIEEQECSAPDA